MTIGTIEESQRKAAKVVGFTYLFALVPAVFAEFYARDQLIVFNNAGQTAQNIMEHERLFRLGIASNLTVFAIDIALITALYIVLRPVNRILALMAAGWGLIETAILVFVTLNDFDTLRILSGADYLKAFESSQLHALVRKVIPLEIYGGLIFVFELAIGFWLLFKGLRVSGMAKPDKADG